MSAGTLGGAGGDVSFKTKGTLDRVPGLEGIFVQPEEEEEAEEFIPAERPERAIGVTGEDIRLGGAGELDPTANRRGKRVLSRPKGN